MPDSGPHKVGLSQLDKFKELARDLECDDDDQRFKERLGRLAKAKPTPAKIDQDEKG